MFFDISVCPDCKEVMMTKLLPNHRYAAHHNRDSIRTAICGCVIGSDKDEAPLEPCSVLRPRIDRLTLGRPADLHGYLAHLEMAWNSVFH